MSVIACALTPEALRAGRTGLLPGLASRTVSRESLRDGYQLMFEPSADILAHIARVIDAERQCCPWLVFTLTVTANAGPIVLRLNGPVGAREFLAALFEA